MPEHRAVFLDRDGTIVEDPPPGYLTLRQARERAFNAKTQASQGRETIPKLPGVPGDGRLSPRGSGIGAESALARTICGG